MLTGYYIGRICVASADEKFLNPLVLSAPWRVFLTFCLILPLCTVLVAYYWSRLKWQRHPIARSLQHLAPAGSTWHAVASSINVEFRRFDKFTTGPLGRRLIVTDSWLMLTSTYFLHVGHQRDIHLAIVGSEEHEVYHESAAGVQFLNILVTSIDSNMKPFKIRLVISLCCFY